MHFTLQVQGLLLKGEIVIIDPHASTAASKTQISLSNSNELLEQSASSSNDLINELEALILTQSLSLWNIIMSYSMSIEEKGVVEMEKALMRQLKTQESKSSKSKPQPQPATGDIANTELRNPSLKKQKRQHTHANDSSYTDICATPLNSHADNEVNHNDSVVKKTQIYPQSKKLSSPICGFEDLPLWRPMFSLSTQSRDESEPQEPNSTLDAVSIAEVLNFPYFISIPSAAKEEDGESVTECIQKEMSSGSTKSGKMCLLSSLKHIPSSSLYFSRLCDSLIETTTALLKPCLSEKIRHFLSTHTDSTAVVAQAQAPAQRPQDHYGKEVGVKALNTNQLQQFLPLPLSFKSSNDFQDISSLSDPLLEDELSKILSNACHVLENTREEPRFPCTSPISTLAIHLLSPFEIELFNIITNSATMENCLTPSSADRLLFRYFVIFLIKILPCLRNSLMKTRVFQMQRMNAFDTVVASEWDLKLRQQYVVAALVLPVILFLLQVRVVRWTSLTWSTTAAPPAVESRISIPFRPTISPQQLDLLRFKDPPIRSLKPSFESHFRNASSSLSELNCAAEALKAGNYWYSPMRIPKSCTEGYARIPKLVQLKGVPMWWSEGRNFGCSLLAYPLPPFLSHGLFMLDVIKSGQQKGFSGISGRELIAKYVF